MQSPGIAVSKVSGYIRGSSGKPEAGVTHALGASLAESTRMLDKRTAVQRVRLISGNLWGIIRRPSGTRTAIKVDECTPPGERRGGRSGTGRGRAGRRNAWKEQNMHARASARASRLRVASVAHSIASGLRTGRDVTWPSARTRRPREPIRAGASKVTFVNDTVFDVV